MYIFTDGITEIKDPGGEMLGAEGFQNYIKKYQSKPNNERLKIIIEDIVRSGKIKRRFNNCCNRRKIKLCVPKIMIFFAVIISATLYWATSNVCRYNFALEKELIY